MYNATQLPAQTRGALDAPALLRRAWRVNWPLTLVGLAMIVVFIGTLIGIVVDPRVITGMPAWVKPAKFALSIAIYSFTFLWLLSFIKGRPRLVGFVASVTALAMVVEMVIIATQAARGLTSHFNVATPLDSRLFSIMGGFIMLAWVMGAVAAVMLLVQRIADPALAWSLRFGLLLALVGAGLGAIMTTPTAAQQAAWDAGAVATVAGAHSVGVDDGGPGLPFIGWSTTGGDLRIGHFIGLHAMQALPFVGWLLLRPRAMRLGNRRRVALAFIAALGYAGLIGLVTWQALRGQPLIAPDATTLAALGALVGGTLLAGAGALLIGRR